MSISTLFLVLLPIDSYLENCYWTFWKILCRVIANLNRTSNFSLFKASPILNESFWSTVNVRSFQYNNSFVCVNDIIIIVKFDNFHCGSARMQIAWLFVVTTFSISRFRNRSTKKAFAITSLMTGVSLKIESI